MYNHIRQLEQVKLSSNSFFIKHWIKWITTAHPGEWTWKLDFQEVWASFRQWADCPTWINFLRMMLDSKQEEAVSCSEQGSQLSS